MLINRIIGAFTFRKGVYAEVEKDTAFTMTAWILVAVVAFLNQLGSAASANLVNWLAGDEARYASGQLWVLDGGLSAQVQQMRL